MLEKGKWIRARARGSEVKLDDILEWKWNGTPLEGSKKLTTWTLDPIHASINFVKLLYYNKKLISNHIKHSSN